MEKVKGYRSPIKFVTKKLSIKALMTETGCRNEWLKYEEKMPENGSSCTQGQIMLARM